jgi:hypothetical protein
VLVRAILAVCGVAAAAGTVAPTRAATPTRPASCEIGARPDSFVPADGPSVVVGCAKLPVSGRRVEFSVNLEGEGHLCVNPAYGDGAFIPAICRLHPPLSELAIRDARQPRQGVDGYGFVVWGTAGDERSVRVRFEGGVARAVLLPVPDEIARDHGEDPFTLFVAELPASAAGGPVSAEPGSPCRDR